MESGRETDKQYNDLNDFLDQCINEALQETTGKFQVGIDNSKGFDYENYKKSDRFKGFKEDKLDPEGEKMKDYERPPPYKIYQRPMTAEETRSYQKHEEDMSQMKPGERRANWEGHDASMRGFDKTEDYRNYERSQTTQKPARRQDEFKETYKSAVRPESRSRSAESSWASNKTNKGQEETDLNQKVSQPKINPHLYQPPISSEDKSNKLRWSRPIDLDKKLDRRFSEPSSYQSNVKRRVFEPENEYETYENFYKNVAKSDLKPDYAKENIRPQQTPNIQQENALKQETKEDKEKMLPGMNQEQVKEELLKLRPSIMERSMWGALPPMGQVPPMKPPADTVVFTLNTGTPPCTTEDECRRTVREIQAKHMGKGLADIQYNFLVGGDGNLYEGRGWGFESGIKQEKQQGKSYNIAFIGDYQDNTDNIPSHMLGPVQELIVWGNAIRLMTKDTKSAGEYRVASSKKEDK